MTPSQSQQPTALPPERIAHSAAPPPSSAAAQALATLARLRKAAGIAITSAAAELTWSNSQQRQVDECPRARYWGVELARQGWREGASAVARLARRLKTLRSLEGEIGRVLHERAAGCARALQAGDALPSLGRMRQQSSADMNFVVHASRHRRAQWMQAPDKVPMLVDHYYGNGPTRERFANARERLERGIVTLRTLGLWGEVAASDPQDIACVDARQSYKLPDPDGGPPVTVWAAPDLIYRAHVAEPWVVTDHKTGRVDDGRSYRTAAAQVASYAPYLRHGLRVLGSDDACRGRLVLLSDGSEEDWELSPQEIDAAEARIREGARRMAALAAAADVAEATVRADLEGRRVSAEERVDMLERARRSAYPMTANRTKCRYCNFRELCAPEQAAELRQQDAAMEVCDDAA